jgi:hypothetical protein
MLVNFSVGNPAFLAQAQADAFNGMTVAQFLVAANTAVAEGPALGGFRSMRSPT